jgi:hypothetical protein
MKGAAAMADDNGSSSDSTTSTTTTQTDDLGDAGKKALADERAARQAADKAAKAASTELERLRSELKKREDAELSETEKLRKQLADAETQRESLVKDRQSERTRFTIEREAARMRFADPADAFSLIDQTRIDFDGNGNPTNVKDLLGDLAKAKPYLTARPGNGSGEGGPRGGNADAFSMDDWLRRAAGKK